MEFLSICTGNTVAAFECRPSMRVSGENTPILPLSLRGEMRLPSRATKVALRAAAQRQQVSESALLKRMLRFALLGADAVGEPIAQVEPLRAERRGRLSVRLTAQDLLHLRARAEARGVAAATYVSMLIRAHLLSVIPIPAGELQALRAATAELAAIGRNVNQIAREVQSGRVPAGVQLPYLGTYLEVCKALHAHFQSYLRANAASWTSGHADPPVRS